LCWRSENRTLRKSGKGWGTRQVMLQNPDR
jgi:hypothetical protein